MAAISGIYLITNIINDKKYVGSSIDIYRRWAEHKKPKNNKSHYSIYRAFKKYGIENFKFSIVINCPKEYLNKAEIFMIKHYRSHIKEWGYNMTLGGDGGIGPKHSDEQKIKWSELRKGKRWSYRDYSSMCKKIVRIDSKMNVVQYDSIIQTKLEGTSISRAINRYKISNKSNYSQGYYWMNLTDYNKYGIIIIPVKNKRYKEI